MPFTGAANTANVEATRGLIENDPVIIQPAGHWATRGVSGGQLSNSRVPTLEPASILAACAAADDTSDAATQIRFTFNNFVSLLAVCTADQDRFRIPNNIESIEIELAKIKLEYAWWRHLDAATGNPATGGLPDLAAIDRIIDMAGAALSFACLERAFSRVTANNGRPTMIMSTSRSLESYRNLCWDAGISPPEMPWRWYDPAKRTWVSGVVTTFRGVPWLINDMMFQGDDPLQRRIYFMVVGDDGGSGPTRGLTRILPADLMHNPYIRRTTMGVPNFNDQTVGMARAIWLTMPAGIQLGSQGALSILRNFEQVGVCPTEGGTE